MANEKRLIDANALMDSFCQACSTNKRYHRTDAECRSKRDSYGNGCFKMRLIENAPTVDAVEVVHGRWIDKKIDNFRMWEVRCSECDWVGISNYDAYDEPYDFNYCPNCGAKMDGGNDHGRSS